METIWNVAAGNLVRRAPAAPVAVSPALEDSDLLLSNIGNDYPDQQGGFQWRADGTYAADLDLNLLATSSAAADRPTGWADLLLLLLGTPGLSEFPPDRATYDGRTALRAFRPQVKDVDVMPGETVALRVGLELPAGSAALSARVTVTDVASGLSWEGGTDADWQADGIAGETSSSSYVDIAEDIPWNPAWKDRRTYRVVLEPIAASDEYDEETYIYASTPALFAGVGLAAIVGHNIPEGATVTLAPQPSGTPIALSPLQPSFLGVVTGDPELAQVWRLTIQMPAGNWPRPKLGEVWMGTITALDRSPQMDGLGYQEADADQIRVEGARKRQEIIGDDGFPSATLKLKFLVPEADYFRLRDGFQRLTRFGKEACLVIPSDEFEGGRFYHGRVGPESSYTRITAAESDEDWRSFTLDFDESPFPAA